MLHKEEILSNDFQVCTKIYEFNEKREDVWFSKLVKAMDESISQSTISKSIDRLHDRGMIVGEWKKADGARWTRTFTIASEFEGFIKGLYAVTEEYKER